jgi:predicted HNH restriction endonuclease
MREQEINSEISSLVASGRITPAMGSLASKIMLAGETVKAKVQINLSDGKTEERETNVRALFTQFVEAMPTEWKISMSTEGKKGVVVDDKLTLTEGSVDKMSKEEYEQKRDELLSKAAPGRALNTPEI